jgi:hypothetical protein
MHALVRPVLLRLAGMIALMRSPNAETQHGELAEASA